VAASPAAPFVAMDPYHSSCWPRLGGLLLVRAADLAISTTARVLIRLESGGASMKFSR
jgi:hypothetical protein